MSSFKNVKAEAILLNLYYKLKKSDSIDSLIELKINLRLGEVLEKRNKDEEAK